MNIGYFADGPWAHKAIHLILSDSRFNLSFICLRFDSPDPYLSELASSLNIPCLVHNNINSDDFLKTLSSFHCDLYISMSFNQIFHSAVRSLPPLGVINCHAGLLPFYRGRNVLNWALINDEKQFGVTVHFVDEGIDTGDIILQRSFPISDNDDYSSLLQRSYVYCAELLFESLCQLISNKVCRVRQTEIHPHGSYCSIRRPGDELLDWKNSSRRIFNFVSAISSPGPCARSFINDSEVIIKSVLYLPDAPSYIGIPGTILFKSNGCFAVKTLDSFILISDYLSNSPLRVGQRFL